MRIKEYTYRNRRDFKAIFECEHCGNTYEDWGYDDANYHNNVVPNFECKECGEKADSNYRPRDTKYPEGMQI